MSMAQFFAYAEQVQAFQSRYRDALWAEDDHGAIIRGQVYIDDALRNLVRLRLPNPDKIALHRKSGLNLVLLGAALGIIDDDLERGLIAFATLRNEFAHRLERILAENDVTQLEAAFSGLVAKLYTARNVPDRGKRLREAIDALNHAVIFTAISLEAS